MDKTGTRAVLTRSSPLSGGGAGNDPRGGAPRASLKRLADARGSEFRGQRSGYRSRYTMMNRPAFV